MGSLPKNWIETDLGNILKLKNGYAFKSKDYREEGIPLIRISNIQQGDVSTEKSIYVDVNDSAEDFIVEKGDVLVAMSGATTGKYGVFNEDIKAYQNQRVGNLKPLVPSLTSRQFIYYLLGGLKKEIEDKAYGGAQPNISPKLIETIQIGLPPLPEQQRIVAKLDNLFGHLEQVKNRLEKIPDLLKNFRQAILTQAVIGKLTEEWREGKELGEWIDTCLVNLCSEFKYGSSSKSLLEGEVPVLRMGNLQDGKVDLTDLKYSSDELEIKKYSLQKGDVLFNRTNSPELVGKTAVFEADSKAIYAGYIIKIVCDDLLNPYYLNIILNSPFGKEWCWSVKTDGVSQSNINAQKLKSFEIPTPPIKEQTEIVRRVESLFTKADAIEAKYNTLKIQIDSLPQAILAKAFKGELVEQLPTDGHAKYLLEEIQALKKATEGEKKKGRRKLNQINETIN